MNTLISGWKLWGGVETQRKYLCAPVDHDSSINLHTKKENLVIYPKAKNNLRLINHVIKEVHKLDPDIEFLMIANMSKDEVENVMSRAKLYMDFGFFPGPERLPREAVLKRCNLIISNQGSAANDVDYPILMKYKCNLKWGNNKRIAQKIVEMINKYEEQKKDFEAFREKVLEQSMLFEKNIQEIFVKSWQDC